MEREWEIGTQVGGAGCAGSSGRAAPACARASLPHPPSPSPHQLRMALGSREGDVPGFMSVLDCIMKGETDADEEDAPGGGVGASSAHRGRRRRTRFSGMMMGLLNGE